MAQPQPPAINFQQLLNNLGALTGAILNQQNAQAAQLQVLTQALQNPAPPPPIIVQPAAGAGGQQYKPEAPKLYDGEPGIPFRNWIFTLENYFLILPAQFQTLDRQI